MTDRGDVTQIRSDQFCPGEIGALEAGIAKVGAAQVNATQARGVPVVRMRVVMVRDALDVRRDTARHAARIALG